MIEISPTTKEITSSSSVTNSLTLLRIRHFSSLLLAVLSVRNPNPRKCVREDSKIHNLKMTCHFVSFRLGILGGSDTHRTSGSSAMLTLFRGLLRSFVCEEPPIIHHHRVVRCDSKINHQRSTIPSQQSILCSKLIGAFCEIASHFIINNSLLLSLRSSWLVKRRHQ